MPDQSHGSLLPTIHGHDRNDGRLLRVKTTGDGATVCFCYTDGDAA